MGTVASAYMLLGGPLEWCRVEHVTINKYQNCGQSRTETTDVVRFAVLGRTPDMLGSGGWIYQTGAMQSRLQQAASRPEGPVAADLIKVASICTVVF